MIRAQQSVANLVLLLMQLRLPVQPPMALLASKTSEGMLGLRWNKLKMGPAHCPTIRSVQVCKCMKLCLQV